MGGKQRARRRGVMSGVTGLVIMITISTGLRISIGSVSVIIITVVIDSMASLIGFLPRTDVQVVLVVLACSFDGWHIIRGVAVIEKSSHIDFLFSRLHGWRHSRFKS